MQSREVWLPIWSAAAKRSGHAALDRSSCSTSAECKIQSAVVAGAPQIVHVSSLSFSGRDHLGMKQTAAVGWTDCRHSGHHCLIGFIQINCGRPANAAAVVCLEMPQVNSNAFTKRGQIHQAVEITVAVTPASGARELQRLT